jgi:UDP-N-acetylglucosamine:LPS N-acetylglucosamine transferase
VLCGKNKSLFDSINRLKQPAFRAMGYISDKQQMLQIYESADAMITKAGGVTMSECLLCMLPIFIYHSLPGQETHNVRHLLAQQVLSTFDFSRPLEAQIVERLFDLNEMKQRNAKLERYRAQFFDPISEATHLSQALRSLLK